jgi:glyoxylase-like metal-dependent hydrolase (beta-lactamase superfamily II)
MKTRRVSPGVHQVGLRGANVFLIEAGDDLVLVDAGLPSSPPRITEAIYSLGRLPQEVSAIVVTHAHRDHVGGLAEMQRRTGAEVWMHPADAALVREGYYGRPPSAAPGRVSRTVARALSSWMAERGRPVVVAHELGDGEELPFDSLLAVHTPGHTAGHVVLLLPHDGGVLFVGDAANNWLRLSVGSLHEDAAGARASLEKLAALEFDVACFAHGRPIRHDASASFGALRRRLEMAAP